MKKRYFAAVLVLCMAAALGAQEGAGLLDISRYSNVGLLNTGVYSAQFISEASNSVGSNFTINAKRVNRDEANRIAALSGDSGLFDTAEEIALLSVTAGVINIRPAEAAGMLPADDPVLIDLQLGAMLYMKKAVVSFLGNGDPAKYAVEIKFITDRSRVTEADIRNFVVQGIAQVVDEQFKDTLLSPREIQAIKDILTIFFLGPNTGTFNAVRDVDYIYRATTMSLSGEQKKAYGDVLDAYSHTILSLDARLGGAILRDIENDFRLKSGTDNVVDLASKVQQ